MEEINEKNIEIVKINESEIPELIHGQFTILSEYNINLEKAKKKAEEVNKSALESQEKGVHVFKMKNSIEDIQANQVALAESNRINMELQEKSMEFQKKLSETMQYLLGLGVTNISMNRCVVKELMMRLDSATEEEIDESTRKEILNVVQQLKAQEDLYLKTMEITGKVKEHESKIIIQENKDIEYDKMFRLLKMETDELRKSISTLEEKLNKHKKSIITLGVFNGVALLIAITAIILLLIK